MSNSGGSLISGNIKCSCKGNNLDKLLQPNILTFLAKEDLHGYLIIQELENESVFYGEKVDNTGVYRTLRILEDRGMVESQWDTDGTGAAKKIYSITNAGLKCLKHWIITLEEYKGTIENIIENAKKVLS